MSVWDVDSLLNKVAKICEYLCMFLKGFWEEVEIKAYRTISVKTFGKYVILQNESWKFFTCQLHLCYAQALSNTISQNYVFKPKNTNW